MTILSRVWDASNEPPMRDDPSLEASLAASRAALLERRATRPQPARDDKALAAWNGLAIAAFAEAGRLLGEERYTAAAVAAAETIVDGLLADDGSLRRSWKDGRAVGAGVLEDYSHLAEGLLALYETTFDERWFTLARGLADRILERFADPAGGFFDTADDHEQLITRPKDPQDNAVPSGGAMAATVLLRLAALTGEGRYRDAAERAIGTVAPYMTRYPTGFAQWLVAASFAAGDAVEVAVVGDPADACDAGRCSGRSGRRGGRSRSWPWRHRRRAADLGRRPAPRPAADRRTSDRLRLPRLRVLAAGDDRRTPDRPARRATPAS